MDGQGGMPPGGPRIRRLPDGLVNRIAAGEVIERPASVVKELVENSLDAGATRIDIVMRDGGRTLIVVADDGHGMGAGDLELAVERHATSKLPHDDLMRIGSLGFRGEALASIGAVSRATVTSRARGGDLAWSIEVEGGRVGEPCPGALVRGTRIEIRDLFHATPARLKFLKSERAEFGHAREVIERLAMAHPDVAFSLVHGERTALRLEAGTGESGDDAQRLVSQRSWEREFAAKLGRGERRTRRCSDNRARRAFPPSVYRNASRQYMFVNGRPVRDALLGMERCVAPTPTSCRGTATRCWRSSSNCPETGWT